MSSTKSVIPPKFWLYFSIWVISMRSGFAQELPEIQSSQPFTIGETLTLRSDVLGEARMLNVYLPPYYQLDTAKRYPVIYLLDGSGEEDFVHIVGLVQFGSFSWINMLPESIVVGIANVDRKRDFTYPSTNERDQQDFPTSGGSSAFITYIKDEVIPLINQRYRTDSASTLIGQSLGGLLATEILLTQPALFDHYMIVSPSLWWDDEKLLAQRPATYTQPTSVYIAVGKEGEVMERLAETLYGTLRDAGLDHLRLTFEFLGARDHGDVLHEAAYHGFEWLFGE